MENYSIIFTGSALNDLEEIILYIAKDSKENALRFHDKIIKSTNKLETFPKLGLLVPDKKMSSSGFRMLVIDKYLLFYKIYQEEISILRVLHGSRDYPKLFLKIKK